MIQSNVIFPYSYTTQHAAVSNYCNLVSELLPILIQFENYYYRANKQNKKQKLIFTHTRFSLLPTLTILHVTIVNKQLSSALLYSRVDSTSFSPYKQSNSLFDFVFSHPCKSMMFIWSSNQTSFFQVTKQRFLVKKSSLMFPDNHVDKYGTKSGSINSDSYVYSDEKHANCYPSHSCTQHLLCCCYISTYNVLLYGICIYDNR